MLAGITFDSVPDIGRPVEKAPSNELAQSLFATVAGGEA